MGPLPVLKTLRDKEPFSRHGGIQKERVIVPWAEASAMQRIEDADVRLSRRIQNLQQHRGIQRFASATPFKRSHTLPPSEMKSLYGSITRSAVSCLSYVTFAMVVYLQRRYAGGIL